MFALLLLFQANSFEADMTLPAVTLKAAVRDNIICERDAAIRYARTDEPARTVVSAARGACETTATAAYDAYIAYATSRGTPRRLAEPYADKAREGLSEDRLLAFILDLRSKRTAR